MLKMHTFNDGCLKIDSRTDVETPLESMLKPFYVVVLLIISGYQQNSRWQFIDCR